MGARVTRDGVAAEDLSDFGAGQGVDVVEGDAHLVGDEVLAAHALELGGVECVRITGDERNGDLAEAVVGGTHDRGVVDERRQSQHHLDVVGQDLVAAAVDDVADAALDPDEAVVVDAGDVAGADEAVGVERLSIDSPVA